MIYGVFIKSYLVKWSINRVHPEINCVHVKYDSVYQLTCQDSLT